MEYSLKTPLDGNITITTAFHASKSLLENKSFYKFLWVQKGMIKVEVDHVIMQINEGEIISLTPLHHIDIKEVEGDYLSLLFNSNFYCIFGHDNEVSCNGFLFYGSSHIMHLKLTSLQLAKLCTISDLFIDECAIKDKHQEEMLRILLKRFIITCTRIARDKYLINEEKEKAFDIVRRFYVLVDQYFKEKKQVQDYAELLFRSPKTLSNLFAGYGLPSPLHVIHERIISEAKRLLLYTNKSGKEISLILGFEDVSTFSRFFKKIMREGFSEYRKREKRE